MTAEDLDLARLSLEIAVDQLTKGSTARVDLDGPWDATVGLPSLLGQLEAAKGANSGPGGAFAPRSKPPLWIDAVSLLDEIDHVVRTYRRPTRAQRLMAWSAAMHALTDRAALDVAIELAENWVRRARALLDPNPAAELDGPCPLCGMTWVRAVDEYGETVRRHALRAVEADEMTGAPAAWCAVDQCPGRWQGEELHLLADHLKRQTASETLAVGQEPTA